MKHKNTFIGGRLKFKNSSELDVIKIQNKMLSSINKNKKQEQEILNEVKESISEIIDTRTEAEKRFDKIKEKRLNEKITKELEVNSKQKKQKFMELLDKQGDKFDIQKVAGA